MAIHPAAVATDADLYIAVNNLSTLLTDNPLTIGATTVNVVSTTNFPTVGFFSIDAEIIKYTGKTATSFTGCTRGADGTTAATHTLNAQVDHNVVAAHHNSLKDEIIAIESNLFNKLGTSGAAYTVARALQTNATTGIIEVSAATNTQLGYLSGVTSDIQTQLAAKATDTLVVHLAGTETITGAKTFNDLRGTFGANINANSFKLTGLAAGTGAGDSLRYEQVVGTYLPLAGGTMSGTLNMGGQSITNPSDINGTFVGYGRNRVVNGAMRFDQRNEGTVYTINGGATSPTLDMWKASGQSTDGVFTVARSTSTPPTGFAYFQRFAVTTADASVGAAQFYYAEQRIEGNRITDFGFGAAGAKTFTVSFRVRSSLTGTFSVAFQNGAGNRSYLATYTINTANTWETKSITVTGDTAGTWTTDNTVGISINFDLGMGSNFESTAGSWLASGSFRVAGTTRLIGTNGATLDVTGVQLELGSTATAYEMLTEQYELAIVSRYVEKSYNMGTAIATNTNAGIYPTAFMKVNTNAMESTLINFKVRKRTNATITYYRNDGTAGSWVFKTTANTSNNRTISTNAGHESGFSIQMSGAEEFLGQGHWIAVAEL